MNSIATVPERRRRLSPEARRDEILESATELISTSGFNSTTVDDFARAARISRPGLLHHFASKEILLEAVLERRDDQDIAYGEEQFQNVSSPAASREVLTNLVQKNTARPMIVQLYTMLSAESLAIDHPAHGYFQKRAARAREYFATHLLAWHPSPPAAALVVISFLDGLQLSWLNDREIDVDRVWNDFADVFFTGTAAAPVRADTRPD